MASFVSKEYAEQLIEQYKLARSRRKALLYRLSIESGICPACRQAISVNQEVVSTNGGPWHHVKCVPD